MIFSKNINNYKPCLIQFHQIEMKIKLNIIKMKVLKNKKNYIWKMLDLEMK